MSRHHHFLVVYCDGEWRVDNDTADMRFGDGLIWDDETGRWDDATSSKDKRDEAEAVKQLDEAVARMNEK